MYTPKQTDKLSRLVRYVNNLSLILERFCQRHGTKETAVSRTPPPELLAMAKIVVPRLCLRLQQQLKELAPYLIGKPGRTCICNIIIVIYKNSNTGK